MSTLFVREFRYSELLVWLAPRGHWLVLSLTLMDNSATFQAKGLVCTMREPTLLPCRRFSHQKLISFHYIPCLTVSCTYFFPFILSAWPLRAGLSLGLELMWAREWISNASGSLHFSYLMRSPRKSGQSNSESSQTCISQLQKPAIECWAAGSAGFIQRQVQPGCWERGRQTHILRFLSGVSSYQRGDTGHVY